MLKWTGNYWGIQKLKRAKDKEETINVHENERLTRLEPWDAERVLGVRLPMNGDMKKEFKYRQEQAATLGKRLYQAPFTPHDAYMVYETRYKPMITYSMPITMFTENRLYDIQKKFIHLLLPKLGMN